MFPCSCCYPRLRELELHNAPELGPDGLAHLTELRQLSRLHLHGVGHRRCLDALLVSTSKVRALLLLGHGRLGLAWDAKWRYDAYSTPTPVRMAGVLRMGSYLLCLANVFL